MKRTYRLERWITAILFSLFVLPFIAEAESFYSAVLSKQKGTPAPVSAPISRDDDQSLVLPEDCMDNAIDAEPEELEHDDECC